MGRANGMRAEQDDGEHRDAVRGRQRQAHQGQAGAHQDAGRQQEWQQEGTAAGYNTRLLF